MATETRAIGPMDVDNTSELTAKLGVHNRAHTLLQRHGRNYPAALVSALSTPTHPAATEFIRGDRELAAAVEEAARSLRGRESFLDEDDVVEDINVRAPSVGAGAFGDPTYFAVLYRKGKSGRSARAALPYDAVPEFDRALKEHEAAQESGGAVAAVAGSEDVERVHNEARAAVLAAEQAQKDLENKLKALQEQLEIAQNPEPFEGYDELKAQEVIERVKSGGVTEFGRAGLERIEAYENAREQPRSTIINAVKDALVEAAER